MEPHFKTKKMEMSVTLVPSNLLRSVTWLNDALVGLQDQAQMLSEHQHPQLLRHLSVCISWDSAKNYGLLKPLEEYFDELDRTAFSQTKIFCHGKSLKDFRKPGLLVGEVVLHSTIPGQKDPNSKQVGMVFGTFPAVILSSYV